MNKLKALETNNERILSTSSSIRKFLDDILDDKSFLEINTYISGKSIIDNIEALGEGVVTGYASINGERVCLFAQNQEVLKGSFSKAQADKIIKVINLAINNNMPLIAIIDSSGARIGEGIAVLEAYSQVIKAISVASIDIPIISIVKGNCVGMMSMVPALSDYVFVSDKALISLSPPSVISASAASATKLTELLGAKAHSTLSNIATYTYTDTASLLKTLNKVIRTESLNDTDDDPNRTFIKLNNSINVKNLISAVSDNGEFIPYSTEFAKEIMCGFVSINGIKCGVSLCDSAVNQSLSALGISKLKGFVELLDKFNIPYLSFVDCAGIKADLNEEQSGISKKLAELMRTISLSGMVKVSIITGKAIGAAYSALASKEIGFDYCIAFANAEITPIDPDVAVNIVYLEELKQSENPVAAREKLSKQYSQLLGDALKAAEEGYIDNVIEPSAIRPYLANTLLMLLGL